MKHLILIAMVPLCSCTVNPYTAVTSNGTNIVSLGGSLLTKSKAEFGEIVKADGTRLSYGRTGKNEVSVANSYLTAAAAVELGKATSSDAASVQTSEEATKQAAISATEATKQAQIQATKEVEIMKLVPPEP